MSGSNLLASAVLGLLDPRIQTSLAVSGSKCIGQQTSLGRCRKVNNILSFSIPSEWMNPDNSIRKKIEACLVSPLNPKSGMVLTRVFDTSTAVVKLSQVYSDECSLRGECFVKKKPKVMQIYISVNHAYPCLNKDREIGRINNLSRGLN